MLKSKVRLHVVSAGILREDTIMLGDSYVKQWKIPVNHPITIRFGSFRQSVIVSSVPKTSGFKISHVLAHNMGLSSDVTLRLTYTQQTLRIGPLIGVLISRDYPAIADRPFGTITAFCREMVDACQSQGAIACFFTPEHVKDTLRIQAWVYTRGSWKLTSMPIPDVVNNRLTSRSLENKPSVQHFMKEVKSRYQSHVFNEKFLDKTEVFDALKASAELTRYLPESHLLRKYSTLKTMSGRYQTLFLKPARGSLGNGIICINRTSNNSFQALYSDISGTKRHNFSSLTKLFSTLSGKLKTNRYQIQQGLNLIDFAKRPIDFRALVQKNIHGRWSITSIVARTASTQHFVSNVARGGTLSTVKEAVGRSNLPAGAKNDIVGKLQQAALDIARGIDTHISAHFGELGIDLAVDTSGKVWLLEVNSKPSKNDNTPLNINRVRPSVRKTVEYARYLSGF
jgi:glutathione synthase/RimK-type ligase-like ATP-grasp enzyme